MNYLPKGRTQEVVVQELDKELLIYDLRTHQAYALNETSKIVFQACDGKTSFAELKRRYKFTDYLIHLTLSELKANDLLVDYQNDHFAGLSRREVIRKVGQATMISLPVIAGMTAPTASQAASGTCSSISCSVAASCPAPCNSCVGTGICTTGGDITCTNLGGACSGTGTCIGSPQSPANGICSVGFNPCSNVGGSCTVTGSCLGFGTCSQVCSGAPCLNSADCPSPCSTCNAAPGICTADSTITCTNFGGVCSGTGTCLATGNPGSGICSVGFTSCSNVGGSCTAVGTCIGGIGTCA